MQRAPSSQSTVSPKYQVPKLALLAIRPITSPVIVICAALLAVRARRRSYSPRAQIVAE